MKGTRFYPARVEEEDERSQDDTRFLVRSGGWRMPTNEGGSLGDDGGENTCLFATLCSRSVSPARLSSVREPAVLTSGSCGPSTGLIKE